MDNVVINITENPVEIITVTVETGPVGPRGPRGNGVPLGGTAEQILAKRSGTDNDTYWKTETMTVNADDIIDGVNHHLVTTAEKLVIDNTSGVNTGDESKSSIESKLGITDLEVIAIQNLSGINTGDKSLSELGGVPTSRKINNHDLTADVTVSKSDLGLNLVDNTSDKNKPLSDAALLAFQNINLDDLKDVQMSTPDNGQIFKYNGTHWVNGEPSTVNAGAGVNFYPTESPSDLYATTGYFYFEKEPDVAVLLDIPVVCNNNKVASPAMYISDPAITLTTIPAGPWTGYGWAYADVSGASQIVLDVYKRTSAGVETLLFTLTTGNLGQIIQQEKSESLVQHAITFNAGERLVFKYSAQTQNLVDTTIHLYGGGTYLAYLNTPYVTAHNDLTGLQGGAANEYYHLTYAEKLKADSVPAGLTTQIQFNDAGTLAGDSNFQFDKTLGVVKIGNGVVPLANNPLAIENSVNGSLQHTIKNDSTDTTASSDIVATADNGTDTTHYVTVGKNGSQYSNPEDYPLQGPNDSYVESADDNLFIIANGVGKKVIIQSGGTAEENNSATFEETGVTIPGTLVVDGVNFTNKVDKITGKGLSANDYTDLEKLNLANQSGVNTNDETHDTIITKIGFTPASENYALVMAVAMGG